MSGRKRSKSSRPGPWTKLAQAQERLRVLEAAEVTRKRSFARATKESCDRADEAERWLLFAVTAAGGRVEIVEKDLAQLRDFRVSRTIVPSTATIVLEVHRRERRG